MSGRVMNPGAIVGRVAAALLVVASLLVASPAAASESTVPSSTAMIASPESAVAPTVPARPTATSALSGSQFNPGLIVSDALFFDSNAMTLAQIQAFLDAKVPACANEYCLADYRTTSTSKAADAYCAAYTGSSSETAASIIFKVQKACGISARAILVTLHKEQGLITKSAPSATAIRIAMGYGCPDTAACDSTYYGFFNQVYQAARQFKRYGNPATSFTWYPLGEVSNVRYHPNAACGARAVRIQNRATAALYYYTPYTPNAAALANLGGTGNTCSSYGNRNFWVYFSTWFGDPLAGAGDAAIAGAYAEAGGEGGVLGAAVAPLAACGVRKSCAQRYENGGIYWMSSTSAVVLSGDVWTEFAAQNYGSGTLGYPTGPAIPVTGGSGTPFQTGTIYTSAAGTFAVLKPLRDVYWANGSVTGSLGWPTGAQSCSGGICAQPFQGGMVFAKGASGRVMGLDYVPAFDAVGGLSGLGMPTSARISIPTTPNGAGAGQSFTKGTIYSSVAGAFAVTGSMKTAYGAAGSYLGALGWPTAHRVCGSAGCRQEFQGGAVFTTGSSAFAVLSDYLAVVDAATGTEALGRPLGARVAISNKNGRGAGQGFQNGTIYSSAAGAFPVLEPIRSTYLARGGNGGALGFPVAPRECTPSGCTQRFQHGTLSSGPVDSSAITIYWLATGGSKGPLGAAKAAAIAIAPGGDVPAGFGRTFTGGTVYSSTPGTFAVYGLVRTEFQSQGGVRGPLGWPVAEQSCSGGECVQEFQGGTIYASASRGGRTILAEYAAVAAATPGLGVPTTDLLTLTSAANGNGRGQVFLGGTIYEGPSGPFVVLAAARDAYVRAGSYGGALGWPTGVADCAGGACAQPFAGGVITTIAGSGGRVVPAPFSATYAAAGGVTTLGGAVADRGALAAGANGSGSAQSFQRGSIYDSAAGMFAVTLDIRTEYLAQGGPAGTLAWPVGAEVCTSGECVQPFTGGYVYASSARGARSVTGDYRLGFDAAGGEAVLGVPTAAPIQVTGNPNGNGSGQPFVNGTVYRSASGTFAVIKPLRDEYWAQGSNAGPLGWPVGPQSCSEGVCTQQFQGGTVTR